LHSREIASLSAGGGKQGWLFFLVPAKINLSRLLRCTLHFRVDPQANIDRRLLHVGDVNIDQIGLILKGGAYGASVIFVQDWRNEP